MVIEKIREELKTNNERYREIVKEKINELIDEINYWKKAHIKLQEQLIRCKEKSSKPQVSPSEKSDNNSIQDKLNDIKKREKKITKQFNKAKDEAIKSLS